MNKNSNEHINNNYERAQNMVMQDKFDFESERFCRELSDFLSDYFSYDSLIVNAVEGKTNNLILKIDVRNVKKARTV